MQAPRDRLFRRWGRMIASTSLGDILRNKVFFWSIVIAAYLLCAVFVVASYSLCGWCEVLLPNDAHDSTTSQAFDQMIAIAFVAALWFSAYVPGSALGGRKGIALLICAPAAFLLSLAMRSLYNPAVFFMGLTAVFVAAEHFGGLKGAAGVIERQATELVKQNKALERQAVVLQRSSETLEDQAGALTEQTNGIRNLLDNYGLCHHRPKIFRHYAAAKERIDVVLRLLDIDHQWWSLIKDHCAGSELLGGAIEGSCDLPGEIWRHYFGLDEDSDSGKQGIDGPRDLTLYQALIPRPDNTPREDKVQFVCRLPVWQIDDDEWTPPRFETLLGLTWRLVVLDEVRAARLRAWGDRSESPPYVRMITADCPCWIHAIDDVVYEVQPNASALHQSRVRQMTGNGPRRNDEERIDGTHDRHEPAVRNGVNASSEQEELSADLERWAHAEVRSYGRSGSMAAEYVCGLFRYLSLTSRNGMDPVLLTEEDLEYMLKRLHFDRWCDWRVDTGVRQFGLMPIDRASARLACWCIFSRFFRSIFQRGDTSFASELTRVTL